MWGQLRIIQGGIRGDWEKFKYGGIQNFLGVEK